MRNEKQVICSDALARAARNLALDLGLVAAARSIGVAPGTLAAVCGRLPTHRATIVIVATRLGLAS